MEETNARQNNDRQDDCTRGPRHADEDSKTSEYPFEVTHKIFSFIYK
jgi:hypothetical protein